MHHDDACCCVQLWAAIDGEAAPIGALFTRPDLVRKAEQAVLATPVKLPCKSNEIPPFVSLFKSGTALLT
jgi:hypothetical protein